MAAITASMVAELRAKTDAPMMECKKALTEADGDMAKAEELLRVKLGTKAGKAASRMTAEGVVASYIDGNQGRPGRSQQRNRLRHQERQLPGLAKAAAEAGGQAQPCRRGCPGRAAYSQDGFGPTLEDVRKGLIGKIGENMSLPPLQVRKAAASWPATCTARASACWSSSTGDEAAAKDVAMHVAAMKPVALASADVPADLIEKERSVAGKAKPRLPRPLPASRPTDDRAKRIEGGAEVPQGSLAVQPGLS
jgi:elongation factor Ts